MIAPTLPIGKIVQGDALEVLRGWPARSVQTCITSPPYWGLRDYGLGGTGQQIGLEATPELHVARLVEVFREVRRVLRDDGTLWLNYGDAYAAGGTGGYSDKSTLAGFTNPHTKGRTMNEAPIPRKAPHGLKPKDLIGLPWMLAFALRDDGWWLRSDIVWAKGRSFDPEGAGSVMPESVRDRPTRSHEYMFLLTKRARYFYDAEAVREEGTGRASGNVEAKMGDQYGRPGHHRAQSIPWDGGNGGRNLRSVWLINPQPYAGAHFATFPEALVEPCIRAGTSERGACPACGAPWVMMVKASGGTIGEDWRPDKTNISTARDPVKNVAARAWENGSYQRSTTGWAPSCGCTAPHPALRAPLSVREGEKPAPHEPRPCVVLDPFAGSGTTGMVAARLGRAFVGIDLAGGDKDMGGHTAHDRIRAAAEGRTTEEAARARIHGQQDFFEAGA